MNTEIDKQLFYLGNYVSFLEQDIQDTIESIQYNPRHKYRLMRLVRTLKDKLKKEKRAYVNLSKERDANAVLVAV
jgi:hypothetical protein